jgi:rubrerythrin
MPSITRAQVLRTTSAIALSLPLLSRVAAAAVRADAGDVKLLETAVEFERAAIKAYGDGAASGVLSAPVAAVTAQFMSDHTAHLEALVSALQAAGQEPSELVAALQAPSFATEADVLNFAYTVERAAAAMYLDAVAQLRDRNLAKTIASILGVDTAHVALLAEALSKYPAYPSGFITA